MLANICVSFLLLSLAAGESTCEDKPGLVNVGLKNFYKSCDWLSKQDKDYKDDRCSSNMKIIRHCPITCDASCENSAGKSLKSKVKKSKEPKTKSSKSKYSKSTKSSKSSKSDYSKSTKSGKGSGK